MNKKQILILAGDGIGPEIARQAEKVLQYFIQRDGLSWQLKHGVIGGAAYDMHGQPLPIQTLDLAKVADAILLGAVGGPKWEKVERALRPERGLLAIRSELALFANLRPAFLYDSLKEVSTIKPEIIGGLDIMIIRELTGGLYFGEPRGIVQQQDGSRKGFNTMIYTEIEIERIARIGFETAMARSRRLCSVDKANVLETTELWREVLTRMAVDYPDVSLSHLYVDNAAMQLVRAPKQFDVMVTTNLFGDILSDLAAMLTGSIGMLPSASLNSSGQGMYEPVHGSAPELAGKNMANPLAMILCVAMMLKYSLEQPNLADEIEAAVGAVLDSGLRTADIGTPQHKHISTDEMGDAVVRRLQSVWVPIHI